MAKVAWDTSNLAVSYSTGDGVAVTQCCGACEAGSTCCCFGSQSVGWLWDAGETYSIGDAVWGTEEPCRTGNFDESQCVYTSLQDGNTGQTPQFSPTWWELGSPPEPSCAIESQSPDPAESPYDSYSTTPKTYRCTVSGTGLLRGNDVNGVHLLTKIGDTCTWTKFLFSFSGNDYHITISLQTIIVGITPTNAYIAIGKVGLTSSGAVATPGLCLLFCNNIDPDQAFSSLNPTRCVIKGIAVNGDGDGCSNFCENNVGATVLFKPNLQFLCDESTLDWQLGQSYIQNDIRLADGDCFICSNANTSDVDNRPGTGVDWELFWAKDE